MLKNLWAQLVSLWNREPASFTYGLSAALVPALTSWQHWDTKQAGAAAAILMALSTVVSAAKARPVSVPVLLGGASAITTGLAAWHVKIPAADLAWLSSLATALLGAHMRSNLVPVMALRGSHAQRG